MSSFHGHPLGIVTLVAHFVQCASAFIVLGITAWAVRGTKSLTVIFALVVSVLTPVAFALSTGVSCVTRSRKWHILPLYLTDTVLSYLWLTVFIFLAQNFNQVSCSISRWNGEMVCSRKYAAEAFSFIAFFMSLGALMFQFFYTYSYKPQFPLPGEEQRAKETLHGNLETAGVL
ncbi:uncharacterized protein N7496_002742 [Penicillium cataractarum]|uniref:MARVEL domain-containing protein n=1 Tax=Penicillium cataractarum TaxID=2100454 RepID=A0A9W9SN33_9EURO|nr:uncharacterized protein N7496_002742 [Penicillium cataractarum]KAJ5380314.1 hypothetical protein N7496_002742 [Penicillium cataractarum]